MSNDKSINDDQEYQLPDNDEFLGDAVSDNSDEIFEESDSDDIDRESESGSKLEDVLLKVKSHCLELADRFPLLKSKKVIIIVGSIASLMIVVHFITPSPKPANTASMQKSNVSQQAQVQSPAPTTTVTQSRLNDLSAKQDSSERSVSQLTSKVDQLSSSLSSVEQSQRMTNQSIRELTQQMKQLSVQMNKLEKEQAALAKPKEESAVPSAKPVTYHIKAVESGRAWILGSNGVSKSVIVGDTINKRYGTVLGIDADQGLVYTSSKMTISFGANDR